MEAVPRLPMIAFELKTSPEYVDFGPVLKQYIRDNYGEDPADYNKACTDLEQLRQSAVHVSHDFMGCSTLKKYYAQLQFLQGRFPMTDGGQAALPFTWEDIFMAREVTLADIKFEQASVLYNIGALHSILGSMETRTNADSMKVACTHFQCASGAFEYLRDHFGSAMMSLDFSHELLTFHVNLMLAQAQECILEKSMIDSRKSSITAKVSAQIVEFNNLALKSLEPAYKEGIVPSRKYKEWKKRMELKNQFYECITCFYMGKQSEEHQKWGECLAYYTEAFNKLNECIKKGKSEDGDIQESFRFAMDVIGGKYQSAKKDNDFVYHDKVPDFDSLPEVKGASLVKGITLNPSDPDVSGPDLFQKLVPMEAHEASSLYSEEKAKLIRRVCGNIEDKNAELVQFMSSLNIDQSSLSFEPENLPQALLEKCAAVSVKPNAIKDLVEAMSGVSNVAIEVDVNLKDITAVLDNDAEEEDSFQKQFGKRSTNPMFENIRKELALFSEGHRKGSQSNNDLHKAMNAHITNLKLLGGPIEDIKNALPSKDKEKSSEDDSVTGDLKRLISKVEEMKSQRNMLEEQFRTEVQKDDITHRIVTQEGGNKQVMFDQEIQKHKKVEELIVQNLRAQDNILRALTDANVKYAPIRRKFTEVAARREMMIKDLMNSFDVYEDLLAKSQKGQEFYRKLESNVSKLLTRCQGLCKIQAEEREQILNRHKPKDPPPRPMAPKPDNTVPDPASASSASDGSLPMATVPPQPTLNTIPGFEGPKLKDYLPFMKPKTFGKDRDKNKRSSSRPESDNAGSMPGDLPGSAPGLPQNLPNQGDLSSYLPRADLQNPSIPQVSAFTGSQQSMRGQSASPTFRPPFNPTHVDVGQSYSSPGPSPAPSPALPSPAHSPLPRQQFRSQSLSPVPHNGTQNLTQSQEYHSLPVGYNSGYLAQSQSSQYSAMSQGQMTGYQGVPQGQMPGPQSQSYVGQTQQPVSSSDSSGQGMLPTQPPGNYYKDDPRQFPQVRDPRFSAATGTVDQQSGHSLPQMMTGQQIPSSEFQHSLSNMVVTQAQQPIGNVGQGPPSKGSQYYQSQYQPTSQNVSMQQPQQFSQAQQSQGVVNQSQQQYSNSVASDVQKMNHQQNIYANQQVNSSGYPANQNAPNKNLPMANQIDPYTGGRASPANIHLGLPYASTHQSRPATSISHGFDKFYTVDSGERSLEYGHQPHDHRGYAPIQSGGPQLHNSKWDAEFPQAQKKANDAKQDPRYQTDGFGKLFMQTGMPYASTHMSIPAIATSHISTQNLSQSNAVPVLTYGHLGYGPLSSTSQSATNLTQTSSVQATGQQQASVKQLPSAQQQMPRFPSGMPYANTSQSMPAMSFSKISSATQNPVMSSNSAQSYMYMSATQTKTQTVTSNVYGNQGNYVSMHQPQQQLQSQQGPQYMQSQVQPQTSDRGPQSLGGSFSQGQQLSQPTSQQMYYQQQASGYPQQSVASYPGVQQQQPQNMAQQQQTHQRTQQLLQQMTQQPQPPQQLGHYPQQMVQQPPQQMAQQHPQQMVQQPQQQRFQQPPQQMAQQPTQQMTQQPSQQSFGQQMAQPLQTQSVVQQQYPQQMTQLQQQQTQARMPHQGMMQAQGQPSQHLPQGVMQQQQGIVQQQQQMSSASNYQCPSGVSYQTTSGTPPQLSTGTAYQGSSGGGYPQPARGGSYQQPSSGSYQSYPAGQLAANVYQTVQGLDRNQLSGSQQELQGLFDSSQSTPLQPLQPLVVSQPHPAPVEMTPQTTTPPTSSLSPPMKQISIAPQQKSHRRQDSSASTTSLDDILSTSPSIPPKSVTDHMLTPKVLTAQEIEQQKEEAVLKNHLARQSSKGPFSDPLVKDRFVGEVEKLAKYVESLTKPTCLGPTNLDLAWKELTDEQDRGGKKSSMAIARCYPVKNREQDSMPYDENRIVLATMKDDYINASSVVDLSPNCPKFITTQSPLPVTLTDFWVMVYEQGSEVIVMLSSETEQGKKFPEYWPQQKGRTEYHGPITLTLQSIKDKVNWVERIIHINHSEKKQGRTVVQLQYKNWPVSGFPENISFILQFITEVHSFYKQQRSLLKPIIVHCGNGTGRTGVFMLVYTCMQDIEHGKGVSGIMDVAKKMFRQRRLAMKEKLQLKYAYEAILFYTQDILAKEGILIKKASFGDKLPHPGEKSNQWTPTEDVLFGSSMPVNVLRTNVAKMGLHAIQPTAEERGTSMEHPKSGLSENLPDVVQRSDMKEKEHEAGTSSEQMSDSVHCSPKLPHSGSNSSLKSLDSASHRSLDSVSLPSFDSAPESKEGSPFHQPARPGNQLSLADLQNPQTFDLGTSEGKKKITKANFQQKSSGLSDRSGDPADPLSSLDPLWSLNK